MAEGRRRHRLKWVLIAFNLGVPALGGLLLLWAEFSWRRCAELVDRGEAVLSECQDALMTRDVGILVFSLIVWVLGDLVLVFLWNRNRREPRRH